MSIKMKIKLKNLSDESRTIRTEETKLKRQLEKQKAYIAQNNVSPEKLEKWQQQARARLNAYKSLQDHRKTIVRSAARSTHLAYGFLRGTPYTHMENPQTRTTPNWSAIEKMIRKYSTDDSRVTMQRFAEWKATEHQRQAA